MLIVTVALDGKLLSLSARRAWIEMDDTSGATGRIFRRSPQGERG